MVSTLYAPLMSSFFVCQFKRNSEAPEVSSRLRRLLALPEEGQNALLAVTRLLVTVVAL